MNATKLYIGQLLDNYKLPFISPHQFYTVNYRFPNDKQDSFRMFEHNEGIDFVISYIRRLEKKIDELQYVEKIIELAKSEK